VVAATNTGMLQTKDSRVALFRGADRSMSGWKTREAGGEDRCHGWNGRPSDWKTAGEQFR